MRFHRLFTVTALSASGLLASHGARAATVTGTLSVSAIVTNNCTVTGGALVFSGYNETAGATGTGTFGVTCTNAANYAISLGAGMGPGATRANRVLVGTMPGDTLHYSLYTDVSDMTVWGDGTLATVTVVGTGTGLQQMMPVYGKIQAGQSPIADSYIDTVMITVTY